MDADSLRDRIADIIGQNCEADGYTKLSTAQAVIDDLGLHYVTSEELWANGLGELLSVEKGRQIVGKWEEEK